MVGWFIGAAINLVGSIAINLGTNVMKLGHNRRAMLPLPEDQKPPVWKMREWQIGTVVFVTGNVANFVSFGFAAQSLLAALGSVQFVSNVIFAGIVLKEKVRMLVVLATAAIIGGCLMLVLFGNHSSEEYTVEQLLDLYRQPAYVIYLVMMFVFVFGSYIAYLHGKNVASQKGRERSAWAVLLPVTYSIFSALLGTQSVLFSKSLSVLLRATFTGDNQLGNWYTYVTLVCFLISAGFWVTRLNKGLRLFDAMIIVPLMQICWTLFSIVSGMLYFQEYKTFTTLSAAMFSVGVSTVFLGVYLLTKGGSAQEPEPEGQDEADGKVEMIENPAFEQGQQPAAGGQAGPAAGGAATAVTVGAGQSPASAEDPDIPQKKLNLDTLRFTSLAASTAANIKTLNKAQSRRMALNSTFQASAGSPGAGGAMGSTIREDGESRMNSTFNTTAREESMAEGSMMGTLRKNVKALHKRLKSDFNVDPDDMKQMLGLGKGGYMPALSLFAMPGVDLMMSNKQRRAADYMHGRNAEAMFADLPQSRFFGKDDKEAGLEAIREAPSGGNREMARLLTGPLSTDPQQLAVNAGSLPGSFTLGAVPVRQHSFTAPGVGAGTYEQGLWHSVMKTTVRKMEELSSKAVTSMSPSASSSALDEAHTTTPGYTSLPSARQTAELDYDESSRLLQPPARSTPSHQRQPSNQMPLHEEV